jgi:hypothetical protein
MKDFDSHGVIRGHLWNGGIEVIIGGAGLDGQDNSTCGLFIVSFVKDNFASHALVPVAHIAPLKLVKVSGVTGGGGCG